jgi:transglutaminase-like putative cysteine protease
MSLLHASCEIDFKAEVPVPVILMLRPRSGPAQWVSREEYVIEPRVQAIEYTDGFGNLCQRAIIPVGSTKLHASCIAETADGVDTDMKAAYVPPQFLPDTILQFLLPSRYCPSEQLGKLALEIVGKAMPGFPQVEAVRTWIEKNVEYKYGTSTTATTAADTARDRVGVCRDFAHLGIALSRALNIPARMVVGYALDLDEPDLHAWFEAYVGGRWYAFDATEKATSGNRITIAYGRDATDVALVTQFGPLTLERLKVSVGLAGK